MDDEYMSRLGQRGSFLLIMAAIEITRGYQIIVTPPLRPAGTTVLHDAIPFPWYGVMWMVFGLAGACFAFTIRAGADRYGYVLHFIPPTITALSYIISWVLFEATSEGDPRGWASSILFLGLVALIYHAQGRAEPQRRLPIEEIERSEANG